MRHVLQPPGMPMSASDPFPSLEKFIAGAHESDLLARAQEELRRLDEDDPPCFPWNQDWAELCDQIVGAEKP